MAQYQAVILHPDGYSVSEAHAAVGGDQFGVAQTAGFVNHAIVWHGDNASYTDLTPAGWSANIYGAGGGAQAGTGYDLSTSQTHAMLWRGTASSAIDLHPGGQYELSVAFATDGDQQGGYADLASGGPNHPALWSGTADSFVDLLPTGATFGGVSAVLNGYQGGAAGGFSNSHALIWHGAADDYVDIHPAGFSNSGVNAMSATDQVGTGDPIGSPFHHALLWRGSAGSAVDLHPLSGYSRSWGFGTNGEVQVGQARLAATASDHAVLWRGSADSFLDLHPFLPPAYAISSAYGIDDLGNIVGYAQGMDGRNKAVVWTPVPEPMSVFGLALGLFIFCRRTSRFRHES